MRLVLALLLLTLVGIFIVARMAPGPEEGTTSVFATLPAGGAGDSEASAIASATADEALAHVKEALEQTPRAFPSELTRRSGPRPSAGRVAQPALAADTEADGGSNSPKVQGGEPEASELSEPSEGPGSVEVAATAARTAQTETPESTASRVEEPIDIRPVATEPDTIPAVQEPNPAAETDTDPVVEPSNPAAVPDAVVPDAVVAAAGDARPAGGTASTSIPRRGPDLRQPDEAVPPAEPVDAPVDAGDPADPAEPADTVKPVNVVLPEPPRVATAEGPSKADVVSEETTSASTAEVAPEAQETPTVQELVPEPVLQPALRPVPGIRGTVSDTGGRGVAKISIQVLDVKSRDVLATVRSGADGSFEARDLPAGRVALVVDPKSVPLGLAAPVAAEVCRSEEEPVGFGAPCALLEAGAGDPVTMDFVLPYSSGLQGTVKDRKGALVQGALVRAVARVEGYESVRVLATTDKDGFFFLSLVPGPYELQVLLPGDGPPEPRMRKQAVEAETGSALVLDTIDFSQPAQSPAADSTPGEAPRDRATDSAEAAPAASAVPVGSPADVLRIEAPVVRLTAEASTEVTLDVTASSVDVEPVEPRIEVVPVGIRVDEPTDGDSPVPSATDGVLLRGRVLSRWGEAVIGLDVACIDGEGQRLAAAVTGEGGTFELKGVEPGPCTVLLGADSKLERPNAHGVTLLQRPEPVEVVTFSGQRRVVLEDAIVEVKRTFQIDGKIVIDDDAFEAFKAHLIERNDGMAKFDNQRFRRIYLRGMRLVQRNVSARDDGRGKRAKSRPVVIEPDGRFQWSCPLPAEDVVFVLEPRSGAPGPGYRGPVGVEVTPAGVRTAALEIAYPPERVADPRD